MFLLFIQISFHNIFSITHQYTERGTLFAFISHDERSKHRKTFLSFLASSATFISIYPQLLFEFALPCYQYFISFIISRKVCFSLGKIPAMLASPFTARSSGNARSKAHSSVFMWMDKFKVTHSESLRIVDFSNHSLRSLFSFFRALFMLRFLPTFSPSAPFYIKIFM